MACSVRWGQALKSMAMLLAASLCVIAMPALGQPNPSHRLPRPPALGGFDGMEAGCPDGIRSGVIELAEVVTRALCSDPRTRQTWAVASAQAALLGVERASFLPKVDGSIGVGRGRQRLDEMVTITSEDENGNEIARQESKIRTRAAGRVSSAGLEFTWTLFDFGQRSAAVEGARQTLLAASTIHDGMVQTVFLEAASAYYALLAAQSAVSVAKEIEDFTRRTLGEAEARSKKRKKKKDGESDASELLQAKASVAEAVLERGRVEGELLEARGTLAVLIGFSPDVDLMVNGEEASVPDQSFVRDIGALLEEARVTHPAIRAAQAQVGAARAGVNVAKRAYAPTLNLVLGNRREHDEWNSERWESRVELQLNIPLFDRARHYQERAALAELDSAQAEVAIAQQQIALDVWTAYQSLKTESAALEHIKPLLEASRELLKSEQDLYHSGEGDMTDLILAQQTLAEASLDRLKTLASWRSARLRLAASLGRLGFWAIRHQPSGR
jgi:outer membrane protein